MNTYNKVMLYFWLVVGILIFVVVTVMGFVDSFEVWAYYYLFSGLAFLMFFTRRWMMKRMERHMKFLEEQKKKEEGQ